MIITKYNKKTKTVPCKCKGMVSVSGEGSYKLPVGFGSRSGRFVVDYVKLLGYFGDCMDCGKKVFAYKSKSVVSKEVKSINKKIDSALYAGASK